MEIFNELKPIEVFKYFEEILQIPRPSKHEAKIIQYLVDFAKENNLECRVDAVGNVLIIKEATTGMENRKTVILQSHLDMVPEKLTELEHNFETDSIKAHIEEGWIKTNGTTLGADDGIGIAAAMAVLASKEIKHGKIEALFTADEETGMTGAFGIDEEFLKGSILINLDSEDEGELFIGSAGGIDTQAVFKFSEKKLKPKTMAIVVSIDKLHGGHSGDEIHKGYANAIKLVNRFLWNLWDEMEMQLANFEGGKLRNAIPKDAKATIIIKKETFELFKIIFDEHLEMYKNEYGAIEPNMVFEYQKVEKPKFVINKITQYCLLSSIYASPHGVYAWDKQMENLVETSTNLATINFEKGKTIRVGSSQRSSIDSAKMDIATKVRTIFELAGAKVKHGKPYPGWKPNPNSEILTLTTKSYKKLFKKQPIVRAIHAGLECGLFLEKYPFLDMISFGPTIKGAHTPEERLEIVTVKKFWDLLLDVLQNIPENK